MSFAYQSHNTVKISSIATSFDELSLETVDDVQVQILDDSNDVVASWKTATETSSGSGVYMATFMTDNTWPLDRVVKAEVEVTATVNGVSDRKKREYVEAEVVRK